LYQQVTTKNNLGTMEGWKKYSPLVEINSDSTLQQLQEGLIEQSIRMRMPFVPNLKKSSFSWRTILWISQINVLLPMSI
jgi:hypothetical protein